MRLEPAKCINCGSVLDVNPTLEKATCSYCGTSYLVKDAIEHYHVSIQNFHADAVYFSSESSSKGRLEAAEAFMKLKKYEEALEAFEDVCKIAPQNYLGWWGQLRALTEDLTKELKYRRELNRIRDLFEAAEVFMPRGKKEALTEQYKAYFTPLEDAYRTERDELNKKIRDCSMGIRNAEQEIARINQTNYNKIKSPWICWALLPFVILICCMIFNPQSVEAIGAVIFFPSFIATIAYIIMFVNNTEADSAKIADSKALKKHKAAIEAFEKDRLEAEKELYFLMTH